MIIVTKNEFVRQTKMIIEFNPDLVEFDKKYVTEFDETKYDYVLQGCVQDMFRFHIFGIFLMHGGFNIDVQFYDNQYRYDSDDFYEITSTVLRKKMERYYACDIFIKNVIDHFKYEPSRVGTEFKIGFIRKETICKVDGKAIKTGDTVTLNDVFYRVTKINGKLYGCKIYKLNEQNLKERVELTPAMVKKLIPADSFNYRFGIDEE